LRGEKRERPGYKNKTANTKVGGKKQQKEQSYGQNNLSKTD
jgi:hypothetical protein